MIREGTSSRTDHRDGWRSLPLSRSCSARCWLDVLPTAWSLRKWQATSSAWPWQFIAILPGRVPEQRKVPLTWENVGVEADILL